MPWPCLDVHQFVAVCVVWCAPSCVSQSVSALHCFTQCVTLECKQNLNSHTLTVSPSRQHFTMSRHRDPIWDHWRVSKVDAGNRKYATCTYCGHTLQSNTSRFKHHLVLLCKAAPSEVKLRFAPNVTKQSIATKRQKAQLPDHELEEDRSVTGMQSRVIADRKSTCNTTSDEDIELEDDSFSTLSASGPTHMKLHNKSQTASTLSDLSQVNFNKFASL